MSAMRPPVVGAPTVTPTAREEGPGDADDAT